MYGRDRLLLTYLRLFLVVAGVLVHGVLLQQLLQVPLHGGTEHDDAVEVRPATAAVLRHCMEEIDLSCVGVLVRVSFRACCGVDKDTG